MGTDDPNVDNLKLVKTSRRYKGAHVFLSIRKNI